MVATYNYLIITALGQQRPETVSELSRACTQCGCNLLQIKVSSPGPDLGVLLYLAGNWGAIAKIEALLPGLEQRLGLKLLSKRSSEPQSFTQERGSYHALAYSIQMTALDKPGILQGLTAFLYARGIPLEEITAHTYHAHTGARMMSLQAKIHIPGELHLASVREQFLAYCDDNNLDAFLEPLRNY